MDPKEKWPHKKTFSYRRLIPIGILIFFGVSAYLLGVHRYLDYEMLKEHRREALQFVDIHWILTPFFFILIYITIVSLSIPGATFFSLLAGFLFRQPFSTIYVILSASIGASIIFLAAKTALGNYFRSKAGSVLKKMEKGFRENAISYLLFLRLVPLFPFWLINLAPAFFGVSLFTFYWTTLVGIAPGAFVYVQAGTGLGAVLDTEGEFSVTGIFNWQLKIAFIALGIFALIPILVKRLRKKHQND